MLPVVILVKCRSWFILYVDIDIFFLQMRKLKLTCLIIFEPPIKHTKKNPIH